MLDFQILGKRTDADGQPRQEVLLVAAQRAMIETLARRRSSRPASRCPAWTSPAWRSSGRWCRLRRSWPTRRKTGVCRGLVDISSSVSTLVVAVDDALKFTQGHQLLERPFRQGDIGAAGHPVRRRLGAGADRSASRARWLPRATSTPPEVVAETQRQTGKAAAELVDEIRRSFDYYQGQEGATPVKELVLSGRGTLVRNLDAHLAEALELAGRHREPAEPGVGQLPRACPTIRFALIGPSLAVAIGLALPEED